MSHVPDPSTHPNAVVVQLELSACSLRGLRTLLGFKFAACPTKAAKPDGLLHHDKRAVVGFSAPRLTLRWYWRDTASLDAWARDERHRQWWVHLVTNAPGTAIRLETDYVRRRRDSSAEKPPRRTVRSSAPVPS